jgi:hypothetical protein
LAGIKLGSVAQRGRRVRLCYVDGFAGPWQAKDAALADTSIAIGLDALEAAITTWRSKGVEIDVDAFFVEKDARAFAELDRFLRGRTGAVRTQAYCGEFGDYGEEELFALYRGQLKQQCGVAYAADLAIPHPTIERTKFRLVVGGNNSKVLELFRDIERRVIGSEAALIRNDAATRATEQKTGQLSLLGMQRETDSHYASLHDQDLARAPRDLLAQVAAVKFAKFGDLWPRLLETHHIRKTELGQIAWDLHKRGELRITNAQPRERTAKDEHILAVALR